MNTFSKYLINFYENKIELALLILAPGPVLPTVLLNSKYKLAEDPLDYGQQKEKVEEEEEEQEGE